MRCTVYARGPRNRCTHNAIGMLGDGAIVMVENIYRQLNDSKHEGAEKGTVILSAAKQVGRPIVFSIVIIIAVFLPIFTLEGVEGKMFTPMAFTISFALLGSILTALVKRCCCCCRRC